MQRAGVNPDVTSYSLLIRAYGKARREDEALAVFKEMLDAGVRCGDTSIYIVLAFSLDDSMFKLKMLYVSTAMVGLIF